MKKLLILALFAGLTQTIKSQTQDGMYAKIKTNKGEILIQLEFELFTQGRVLELLLSINFKF